MKCNRCLEEYSRDKLRDIKIGSIELNDICGSCIDFLEWWFGEHNHQTKPKIIDPALRRDDVKVHFKDGFKYKKRIDDGS